FFNVVNPDPGTLPDGSEADVFIDQTRAAGGEPLMSVPILGFTPTDRSYRYGFSIAKYMVAQQYNECTYTGQMPPACNPDMRNGCTAASPPGGCTPVVGNDPADTSTALSSAAAVALVRGWKTHIAGRTGTAATGGVRFFGL